MKHHGSCCDFNDERDDDIMRTFRNLIREKPRIVVAEVFELLVNMPSRRFWVSEERALVVVNAMLRGRHTAVSSPSKREMFAEIFRRVCLLLPQLPHLTLADVVARVVRSPAPKFYLTPQSARIIYYRTKNKWFKKELKRLQHLRHA